MVKKPLPNSKKEVSPDWFLKGILTKFGEGFDRLTGRNWKPSSNIATSELIERLKLLLDAEVKELDNSTALVPHNIKLKIQWDKFSTDSDKAIDSLKNELHIAAIDHINDRRYYTYSPISVEIIPDYFTEGVKMLASFEKFDEDQREAVVNVTLPDLNVSGLIPEIVETVSKLRERYVLSFELAGKRILKELEFEPGDRKSVGRTKENQIVIDDASISKIHAALVLNSKSQLVLADTGSTNGTFINGKRIAYGRAFEVNDGDNLKFGTVIVALQHLIPDVSETEETIGLNGTEEFDSEDLKRSDEKIGEHVSGLSEVFGTETDGQSDSSDYSSFDAEVGAEAESTKSGILLNNDESESG
jgi:FHA domain